MVTHHNYLPPSSPNCLDTLLVPLGVERGRSSEECGLYRYDQAEELKSVVPQSLEKVEVAKDVHDTLQAVKDRESDLQADWQSGGYGHGTSLKPSP